MVILIRFNKLLTVILILAMSTLIALGFYLRHLAYPASYIYLDEGLKSMLTSEIDKIFNSRNTYLLEKNSEGLKSLYNVDLKPGLYAYEHELIKMTYLHLWSNKQAVAFKSIDSQVIVRTAKEKGEGYSVNLLVSTEYKYVYEDTESIINTFRIGTYHTLDLLPKIGEGWIIVKEWYTDPFADSLHLDDIKSQEIKEIILSSSAKDLSDLNERRIKAVEYADEFSGAASLPQYGFNYNPKYRNYNPLGGDCANFASQILFEGGGFRKNSTWNYEKGKGSRAWINASGFNNYMLNSGRASLIASGTYLQVLKSSYRLLPGDYVAYQVKGKVTHISMVTGIDSKGYPLVNSHNSDRHRVPWDLGWSDKGVQFKLVRVHY